MRDGKIKIQPMTEFLSKYKTYMMGICIIWIVLFHSGIEAPANIVLRAMWYVLVSFGGVSESMHS